MFTSNLDTRNQSEILRLERLEYAVRDLLAQCDLHGYPLVAIDLCAAAEKLRTMGAAIEADLARPA